MIIKAIKDFPLYDDNGDLKKYVTGEVVNIRNKALVEKLIDCGKCEIDDPRKKESPAENKVIDDYEKKIDPPAKKKRKRK